MKNGVKFYRCAVCGNIVGLIKNGGGELYCCGQPMTAMDANKTDASQEKHVPVVTREEGKVLVQVGSAPHPMQPEHYIEWIAVMNGISTQRISLEPGDKPEATFADPGGKLEVYAYCNLHSLWMTEA